MIPEKQIPTKAFVVDAPGSSFVLRDVVLDEVRDNEILVEMKYTGLCHTVRPPLYAPPDIMDIRSKFFVF